MRNHPQNSKKEHTRQCRITFSFYTKTEQNISAKLLSFRKKKYFYGKAVTFEE